MASQRGFCQKCNSLTAHRHVHDTAHGIPETHMAGTERFVCDLCGHQTFANDPGAESFKFLMDKAGR